MKKIYPAKLKKGDKIMVIAPSDSLSNISKEVQEIAQKRFADLGLEVSFANNVNEIDEFDSSSIESRVADLHQAFSDNSVKAIFTAFGGYNANQLLRYINWDIIKNNPKILIGFSDTTALQNAIFAKTGLVTYSGPSYSRFGQELYFDYTLDYVKKSLFETEEFIIEPSNQWSDDWWFKDQQDRKLIVSDGFVIINEGEVKGTILGANLCTFNLLQGTEYMPDITDSILFIEDDMESQIGHFDRDLQSLIHLPDFDKVKGIVIGRFQKKSEVETEQLIKLIKAKKELDNIPVLVNVDFGHTDPIITFPIGGEVSMVVSRDNTELRITKH